MWVVENVAHSLIPWFGQIGLTAERLDNIQVRLGVPLRRAVEGHMVRRSAFLLGLRLAVDYIYLLFVPIAILQRRRVLVVTHTDVPVGVFVHVDGDVMEIGR